MYPLELVAPMARDLTDFGFEGLSTAEEVDTLLQNEKGTVLMVINSVCGCAAANARPAAKLALNTAAKPNKAVTVFAGVHKEAVAKAREYLLPYPPSSPAIAKLVTGAEALVAAGAATGAAFAAGVDPHHPWPPHAHPAHAAATGTDAEKAAAAAAND